MKNGYYLILYSAKKLGTGTYTCIIFAQKVVLDDNSHHVLNTKILIIVNKQSKKSKIKVVYSGDRFFGLIFGHTINF